MYKNGKLLNNIQELLSTIEDYELVRKKENKLYVNYVNLPCSFDIEVSSFRDYEDTKHSLMYIWMFGINGNVVIGRTWEEFFRVIEEVRRFFELDENRRIAIYVHNLAYEFQFIKDMFEWKSIFAREKRSPMKALTTSGFEFRCSYMLSGSSLANTAKDLTKYKVEKMVGDLDYSLIRTPLTPLTDKELGYCINDVLVVMALIQESIETYGDITKIPMTNTGKVRLYCRNKCLKNVNYQQFIKTLKIGGKEEYNILKRAFQGGFTHANWLNVGYVHENVQSFDFTSSYPSVMVAEKFPMSSGVKCNPTIEEIEYGRHCYIFNIKLYDVEPKFIYEHYLGYSKCYNVKDVELDNGRIIRAKELITTITEIDWEIIKECYTFSKVEIGLAYRYNKGYLPTEFVSCILDFYVDKTTLKDVVGEEARYQLKKGMLNSGYGMTVTDPVVDTIKFEDDWIKEDADIEKSIEDYNKNRNRFLFYPWGVYVTAYARYNLWRGILECGKDYIYSDTDSIKILNREKHYKFIDDYNDDVLMKLRIALSYHKLNQDMISPKTVKGKEKPLGIWDDDGYYKHFKTLGAKRYLVENEDGLKCTIAGVNKKDTSKYISEQENPWEFFNDKMSVDEKHSGRNIVFYIDEPFDGVVVDYKGVSYEYHELSGINIEPGEYNLTMSPIYSMLLSTREQGVI